MKKVMKVIAAGIVCTCIFCFGKAIRDKCNNHRQDEIRVVKKETS